MNRSISGNVRLAAYTEPPKRPTQTASHAGVSMGASGQVALQQDITDPEATISIGERTSEEDSAVRGISA